jgi:hypothetical protein
MKKGALEISPSTDAMHDSIQDIVKVMRGPKLYLF